MKKYSDKMMHPIDKAVEETLMCQRECEAPGIGSWKPGEKISDPELVKRFRDNPNFKVTTREEK
jgi:hypothetical protein